MSFYSQYRGRSIGRVMHGLWTYCGSGHRMDETQIGDGQVKMGSKVVATYEWIGEDTPHFTFIPGWLSEDYCEQLHRKQAASEKFLDDPYAVDVATYVVQEVRNCLTFSEALAIQHVRDKMDGDWSFNTVHKDTAEKIKATMRTATYTNLPAEWYEENWKHFALCAIMDI